MQQTQQIILAYFNAWQNKEWEKMERLLSENFKIDGGQIQFPNRQTFIEFCKHGPSWKNIKLIDSLFGEKKGALLYEGVTPTGEKIRIAEFLETDQKCIQSARIAIAFG